MPLHFGNGLSPEKTNKEPPNYDEAMAANRETPAPSMSRGVKLAMISFAWTDRVRLIHFPEPIIPLVTGVLEKLWPKGLQRAQPFEDSLEIKLRGNPFHHGADDEKIAIRVSLMGILESLAKEGWHILPAGGRVTRLGNYAGFGQKDSWVFRLQEPRAASWLCISFLNADILHLINSSTELATALISAFGDRVEKCNKELVSGVFELKFKEQYWAKPSPKGMVQSRVIVLALMQCLEEQGYTMCTSIDLDSGIGGTACQSTGEVWFWYR
ncbi:hypothetical protein FQN50_000109 [Emmonsiellopsis sp. PD_5]|nr:hypothetical protein FQN50_000109 [Emmonsiellopsis sp. PD_5]